jgi:hypothetical protein
MKRKWQPIVQVPQPATPKSTGRMVEQDQQLRHNGHLMLGALEDGPDGGLASIRFGHRTGSSFGTRRGHNLHGEEIHADDRTQVCLDECRP